MIYIVPYSGKIQWKVFQGNSIYRVPCLSGNGEPLASDGESGECQQPDKYAARRIRRLFCRFLSRTLLYFVIVKNCNLTFINSDVVTVLSPASGSIYSQAILSYFSWHQ